MNPFESPRKRLPRLVALAPRRTGPLKLRRFAFAWATAALVFSAAAADKVYLDINAPTLKKIPLAVPALRHEGGDVGQAHIEVAETLRRDLGLAGLFEVLNPQSFLEDPQRTPVQPDAPSYADWVAIGAEVLTKGQVARKGDLLSAELWMYDVLRRQELFPGRRYDAPPEKARFVAHMFANTVLEELTGTPGPFGTRIAYIVQEGRAKELAMAGMDGGEPVRLTRTGSISLSPSWSMDGRYLYYVSYMRGDPDLYLMDLTTWKHWVVSREKGINLSGKDSPDGAELLLVLSKEGNSEIYRMDKSTRKTVRLTTNPSIDVSPTWSPDGKRIAFVSDRAGNPHIFVMDRDGGGARRITLSGSHNGDPDWSPKGDLIAFTGKDERSVFQVYTVDPNGQKMQQLTFGGYDTLDPSWSPDGRFLAVTSNREGRNAIYLMRLGSSEYHRVSARGEDATQPTWCRAFPSP